MTKLVASVPNSQYSSVSVRKIDNGYLICKSDDSGYSETFSAEKPEVCVAGNGPERNPMSTAIAHIKKGA